MAALSRTPLAGILAQSSRDYLAAWALLGTWTCTLVWPTPDHAKWPKACYSSNQQLRERQPYLGAWARSSFEQGALCARAAMSSRHARYVAIPGDACFQCHGVGPCVASPAQAVLPLVIHYYGNKDAIHELDQITAMPYLAQSLFGHGTVPPYWCSHEWKAAADFAVACKQLPTLLWAPQTWACILPRVSPALLSAINPQRMHPFSPYAVLPVPAHITDGLPAELTDGLPASPPIGAQVVHVYGTGLNGGLPAPVQGRLDTTRHSWQQP